MLSFFPRGVLDEILNLIESVSEGFPSNSYTTDTKIYKWALTVLKSLSRDNDLSNDIYEGT